MSIENIAKRSGNLPVFQIADAVNQTLSEHNSIVITAAPGSGKSTVLPLTMLQALGSEGKIIILEPRRIAARQIAERMAYLLGEPIGKTVGYRIRFETKVSKDTRIEVVTEGILTRMLIEDATLDGVNLVVFDEFHERSLAADLAFALTHQTQQIIRDDLKIVIMSATIDVDSICHSLLAPMIESQGKMFPVEIVYAKETPQLHEIVQVTAATILKAYREQEGDMLIFLPGQGEIVKCAELLEKSSLDAKVFPLYGNLSQEAQKQAIAPSLDGERKIVLATPIAETSITIEGVKIVIDAGYCRRLNYDAKTGLSHLDTVRISKDMAVQRAGRAGRVTEGTCYRLWTMATEHQMEEQRKPEILEADLSSMLLEIAAFGETSVAALPWLTPPPTGNLLSARDLLVMLRAIILPNSQPENISNSKEEESSFSLTPLGKVMVKLPCHPRIAKMISGAKTQQEKSLACDVAALLEEKDPLSDQEDKDITLRISLLRNVRRKQSLGRWAKIAQNSAELHRMCKVKVENQDPSAEAIGRLVALAYPERIALAMDHIGNYRLANGNRVRIESADPLIGYQWLAVASMHSNGNAGKVFLAAPVCEEDLLEIATEHDHVSWDSKQGCVVMQREKRIGRIIIDSKPIHDIDKSLIINIICEAVRKDGLSMFDWNEQVQMLQRRVAQVAEWHPELEIPNLSTPYLMEHAQDWLPFYLEEGNHVISTNSELKKINLKEVLWNSIPYELQQEIDRLAPTHIQVPSGSRIKLDYRQGTEIPVLSVRLQECFGMKETPCVNDGKQPVLMELLSPGFKPVQLTQDLGSFWQGTYFEVRKELKRRYPKHFWPENPLESEAVKGVKR